MSQSAYLLIASCALLLAGCRTSNSTAPEGWDLADKILGKWEMVDSREHPRQNPPTETIELVQGGGFVMRMDGKVEMEGRFRVEKDKVILTHPVGQTPMGSPMTIKRLTAASLVLTSEAGTDGEFVRK